MLIRLVPILAVLALLAAACQPAAIATTSPDSGTPPPAQTSEPSQPSEPSILRFHRAGGVTPIWHPNARETGVQNIAFELIFSNLLDRCWQGDAFELCGDLAETWETTDGQTFTFALRRDVTWHDGQPFTAHDVAFTINRSYLNVIRFSNQVWEALAGADEVKSGAAETASGVEVVDDYTIRLTTKFADVTWLNELPEPYGSIVPEHILKGTDPKDSETTEFSTSRPIGTGPYRFVTYEPDQYIEFEAYPGYFRGPPKIDRLFFRLMSGDLAIAQLEAGQLDLSVELNPAERTRLEQIPNLDIISSPGVGNSGLYFNLLNVPDAKTRQAIAYAVDAQGIIDAVYGGAARANRGIAPGMPVGDGVQLYDYDPVRARELLLESSWDLSRPLRILFDPSYAGYPEWMPIVQQQLEAIGLNVQLNSVESAAFIDTWNQVDQWEIVVTAGSDMGVHPFRTQAQYQCNLESPAYFTARRTDCRIDDLFVQARREPDDSKRQQIFLEITKILSYEMDWISLFTPNNLSVKVKELEGVNIPANAREFAVGAENWELTK